MSFIRNAFQTMHPAAQVVMLGCIVLTFMALAAGVGVLWPRGAMPPKQTLAHARGHDELDRNAVLAMNNANQLMAFLGASLAFAALVGMSFLGRFFLQAPALKMLGLAVVIALGMSPVLDFTYRLNEWALVPGSDLHAMGWRSRSPGHGAHQGPPRLFRHLRGVGSLFSVAVLPALCEEWLFRGTLQPILVAPRGTSTWAFGCRRPCSAPSTCNFLASSHGCSSAQVLATSWCTAEACGPPSSVIS